MNFKELFGIASEAEKDSYDEEILDIRLEQVEQDGNNHLVVVSFVVKDITVRPNLAAITGMYQRIYKQIRIDKDKNVVGLYIFQVS